MIYGVDVGTRRVAVSCPGTMHLARHEVPKSTRSAELVELAQWFSATVPGPADVWIEAPIVGGSGNAQTAISLSLVVGALAATHARGQACLVAPSSWKASVIGSGRASKDDVRRWVESHYPQVAETCARDQDLLDATCVAFHGALSRAGMAPAGSVPG